MTTAQLFAEALATIPVLLRAGAVWLVLLCGAAGLAVYAAGVAVWALPCAAWRAVGDGLAAGAALRAYSGGCGGSGVPGGSPGRQGAPGASGARTEARVPSWAHTDTDNQPDIEEAA